ncbi:daptide-type RiPP biosynthesis methyltransferase [Luteipulveratus mongoliensis]|uniref:Methyltransferase domain-containing protein n=1 Tax=Luteipulveratus mongoliensis TaxID=571913 RepID=A0A0K1JE19_9MICO|nr:daptide-type RiPP biosynthesis methyltransferase [Luteipulveratus mongoliensis]AKU14962.1 hypothetical protein VV02_02240 [Luteipulveratus mongoliensis]
MTAMASEDLYSDAGAVIYDDIARHDASDLREMTRVVRDHPGPVLDLAAGGGRLTFPFLALGREVTALDYAPAMVRLLGERLGRLPRAVQDRAQVVHGDMSAFDLGTTYGVITVGTTSASLLDDAGRAGLFSSARQHLDPDGVLVLTTVHLSPTWRPDDPAVELQGTTTSGRPLQMREHVDPGRGHRDVTLVVGEAPDAVDVFTTRIRLIPPEQIRAEAEEHGLSLLAQQALPLTGNHLLTELMTFERSPR